MKHRLVGAVMASATMVGLVSLLMMYAPSAQSQARRPAPDTTPVPRMSDGHPDFSGFYQASTAGLGGAADTTPVGQPPPYKPEYMERHKGRISQLDPVMNCKPQGVPRTGLGNAIHIVQNPKLMTIMYEDAPGPQFRIIYTDGRKHPEDLDTSYMGHSIGHWEGDTLVVDTVGLNDDTWLGLAGTATIHSDQMHVIERFTRPSGNTIQLETTVEDPVMFTKPWVLPVKRNMIGPADDYVKPQACTTSGKA